MNTIRCTIIALMAAAGISLQSCSETNSQSEADTLPVVEVSLDEQISGRYELDPAVMREDLLATIDPEDTATRQLLESMLDDIKMSLTLEPDGTGNANLTAPGEFGSIEFDGTWTRNGDEITLRSVDGPERIVHILIRDGWLEVVRQLGDEGRKPLKFVRIPTQ